MLERMIRAGMNVARLNFSHGEFESHRQTIERLRFAAKGAGRNITIMADMPGPKMRIGQIENEPVYLPQEGTFTLTARDVTGNESLASVTFKKLPAVVKPGNTLFLNDGLIQLEVQEVQGADVHCKVLVGGELRSRKGLNLPGIDLGISAFTDRDRECLKFAIESGVDAISQSFVESRDDILAVREAAKESGRIPFIIAKIERTRALERIDEILEVADGIMIARGDLGVEIPIERIAMVQKQLTRQANIVGKPVITATQMLESMTDNRRPTRAEATDVANAILDGTDCVMLSEESAMGKYPVEAVEMLGRIARETEPSRSGLSMREALRAIGLGKEADKGDLISVSMQSIVERMPVAAIFIPTHTGATARRIGRFRLPVWIAAASRAEPVCSALNFSYGIFPIHEPGDIEDWSDYARSWTRSQTIEGDMVIVIEGPSRLHPEGNHKMEIVDLKKS
jgi:pyruvate kinase